jgi:hypothetical protein
MGARSAVLNLELIPFAQRLYTFTCQDPETGEVRTVKAGEMLSMGEKRRHFGYNFGNEHLHMLEFIAAPAAQDSLAHVARPRDLVGWDAMCQSAALTLRFANPMSRSFRREPPTGSSITPAKHCKSSLAGREISRGAKSGRNAPHSADKALRSPRWIPGDSQGDGCRVYPGNSNL